MRGGIAGCATFLVTGYRNRPVHWDEETGKANVLASSLRLITTVHSVALIEDSQGVLLDFQIPEVSNKTNLKNVLRTENFTFSNIRDEVRRGKRPVMSPIRYRK